MTKTAPTRYAVTWGGAPNSEVEIWLVHGAPGEATLKEVCALCKRYGVKATLSDAAGWKRWWVSESGDFRAA